MVASLVKVGIRLYLTYVVQHVHDHEDKEYVSLTRKHRGLRSSGATTNV